MRDSPERHAVGWPRARAFLAVIILTLICIAALACGTPLSHRGQAGLEVLRDSWGALVSWATKAVGEISPTNDTQQDGRLRASGVVSVQETRVGAEVAGHVSRIAVAQAAAVEKDDILVELESSEIQAYQSQAEAAVRRAQAELAMVQSQPRADGLDELRAKMRIAEADRLAAEERLASALAVREEAQMLRQKLSDAETSLQLAKRAAEGAEADYQRALHERDSAQWGSPQRRVLEFVASAHAAALEASKAEVAAAEVALEHLRAMWEAPIGLDAQVNAALGDVAVSSASTQVASATLADLAAGPRPAEIALSQAQLDLSLAQLDLARMQTDRLVVRAPRDGIVMDVIAREGESVQPAAALLTIGDMRRVTVDVYVPEPSLGRVSLGQRVQVTVDGLPGRVFSGQVERIGDQAEYTPRNLATQEGRMLTYYSVEVSVPNGELVLKPGMPVDLVFD